MMNSNTNNAFCNAFIDFLDQQKSLMERRTWYLKDFNLAQDRVSLSVNRHKLVFDGFVNFETERLVKLYIKYLLENTGLALTTIGFHKTSCMSFFNSFNQSPLELKRTDIEKRKLDWMKKFKPRQYNDAINVIRHFYDFLIAHDICNKQIVFLEDTIKGLKKQYIRNSLDDYTTTRLFHHLNEFPDDLALMIMVLYCTGMRVSEVCSLKRNCLEETQQGYFIKFYSQKMKKEVFNVIPSNLYQMIVAYRNNHIENTDYLFPSKKDKTKPHQQSNFKSCVNNEIKRLDIRTSNGELYHFAPHSFRHTMGKRMREQNIAFQFIQEQLHHLSPEMTMHYVEYMDREKVKKYRDFIDIKGMSAPIQISSELNSEEGYAEYMRSYINAQMLPNGVCARPVKLGTCKHCNSCLTCSEFRTSVDYLSVHKEHLAQVEQYIKIAEKNHWLPQIETNKQIKQNLLTIIETIEGKYYAKPNS